jgi:hypothetical protein
MPPCALPRRSIPRICKKRFRKGIAGAQTPAKRFGIYFQKLFGLNVAQTVCVLFVAAAGPTAIFSAVQ